MSFLVYINQNWQEFVFPTRFHLVSNIDVEGLETIKNPKVTVIWNLIHDLSLFYTENLLNCCRCMIYTFFVWDNSNKIANINVWDKYFAQVLEDEKDVDNNKVLLHVFFSKIYIFIMFDSKSLRKFFPRSFFHNSTILTLSDNSNKK